MPEEEKIQKIPAQKPKMNWKRIFKKILFWFIMVFFVLLLFVFAFRNQLISCVIRNVVPKITGTKVQLKEFSSTPSGAIYVRGLQIGNPAGYSQPHIFKVSSIYVKLDLPSMFCSMPIIEVVEIRGLNVNYEMNGNGVSNLDVLQKNIELFSGTPEKEEEEEEDDDAVSPLLRHLSMSEMSLQSGAFAVPLPPISVSNLGGTSSLSASLKKIFNGFADTIRLTGGSLVKGVSAMGETGKQLIQSGIDAGLNLGNSVVNFFNTTTKKEKK